MQYTKGVEKRLECSHASSPKRLSTPKTFIIPRNPNKPSLLHPKNTWRIGYPHSDKIEVEIKTKAGPALKPGLRI